MKVAAGSTVAVAEQRIHFFDWLRVLAVLGVVVYHALQPFASANWFIVNDRVDPALAIVVNVLAIFGMYISASRRVAGSQCDRTPHLAEEPNI